MKSVNNKNNETKSTNMDKDQALGIVAAVLGLGGLAVSGSDFGNVNAIGIISLIVFAVGLYFAIRKI